MAGRTVPGHIAVCLSPNPHARLRLYCFPYAGGGPWAFTSWGREFREDVRADAELWAVSIPGRELGISESTFESIDQLAEAVCHALAPCLQPPYAFFGHSMGALLGFEVARRLEARDVAGPVHLVVSGHRAPQLPDRIPAIHNKTDGAILRKLRELGGTRQGVFDDPELRDLMLPMLRADLALCETYEYRAQAPLACSLTAFGGNEDPHVRPDELYPWGEQTRSAFTVRTFPGGHFYLETARVLFLRVLGRELTQAALRVGSEARD